MALNLRTVRADYNEDPLTWGAPESLTQADIQVILTTGKGRTEAIPALQRITERHHALARLIAVGTPQRTAGIIVGYSDSRISILMDDPSFQELVAFYSGEVDDEYRLMHAQMAGLGSDAIQELRRRMEDEPEKLGANFLLDVVKTTADRTGNGPTTTTKSEVNVTIDLASRMKAARESAMRAIQPKTIDITPTEDPVT